MTNAEKIRRLRTLVGLGEATIATVDKTIAAVRARRLQRVIVASQAAPTSISSAIGAFKALGTNRVQFDEWRDRALAEIAEEYAQLRQQDCGFWRTLRDTAMAHARHHRSCNDLFDAAAAVSDARRANHLLIAAARHGGAL